METIKELKNRSTDDVLAALGLQRRTNLAVNVLSAAGVFGAGMLIGTAIGILVAPYSGRETRRRLQRGIEDAKERAVSSVGEGVRDVRARAGKAGEEIAHH